MSSARDRGPSPRWGADQKVRFSFYRDGLLWYETERGFLFPVPVADVGTATFKAEDRAMLFMRYIRRQLATLEAARAARQDTGVR